MLPHLRACAMYAVVERWVSIFRFTTGERRKYIASSRFVKGPLKVIWGPSGVTKKGEQSFRKKVMDEKNYLGEKFLFGEVGQMKGRNYPRQEGSP